MNFKKVEPKVTPFKPDLARLAREITEEQMDEVKKYAPPAVRGDMLDPENQVKTFGELPTKEIDVMVQAAEEEIENLKREGQAVRDIYVKHTNRIVNRITRLREGVKLSIAAMNELRQQCANLDEEEPEQKQLPFKSEKD